MLKNNQMGLKETIHHQSAVVTPEGNNYPVDTFIQDVNLGLERTIGRDGLRQLEQRRFIQGLRNPACEEIDEATGIRLDKKGITSSFWKHVLVFSSHEECFLPGQLSFMYDKGRRKFVLSLGKVLMNTQDIRILCSPLERFDEQRVQTRFAVQQKRKKCNPTPNMALGIDRIMYEERVLCVLARYHDGHPQISLSVLNVNSNWRNLFDDTGKLKAAQKDDVDRTAQASGLLEQIPPIQKEVPPPIISALNNALKQKGVIKPEQLILPHEVFLPKAKYTPGTPQVPIYIVAEQEEIDGTTTISVSRETGPNTLPHQLTLTLNGIFLRCYRDEITFPYSQKDDGAILLTLNPKAWMCTDITKRSEGFYRKEKGILTVPFELPKD